MATHSSVPAWRSPWMEQPGGLQSMGSQRVRHGWTTNSNSLTISDIIRCLSFSVWLTSCNMMISKSIHVAQLHYFCFQFAFCHVMWRAIHLWALRETYGEGNGTPLQYSCLENPMDRGAWVGCSPWGCEESDMTEQLHFHFSLLCIGEGNGNPLQCSCLENPTDGGAWGTVYGVAKSRTWLTWLSSSSSNQNEIRE